jgi:DNA polymerase III subunit epsilon
MRWPRSGSRRPCGAGDQVLDRPWREVELCGLDFETTGLDLRRDEIVSFGAVLLVDGRIRLSSAVYQRVRPDRPVPAQAAAVHALTTAELVTAARLEDHLDQLVALVEDRVLLAHGARIEHAFLDRALARRGLRLRCPVIDTAVLAERAGFRAGSPDRLVGLEYLAGALHLTAHTPHHALGDALTTAEAFLALAARLEGDGARTVRDLAA